jgi:2-polyprenyl-6-methoxyphenol hydroxylase-like FAD-dependent oxidoreductase
MAHVIVVGAGPAGAALAYLLARRGIRVSLIERQKDFEREFRGEVLMPSGVDALEQMGLSAPFAGVPQVRPARFELYLERRFAAGVDLGLETEFSPRIVSQPAMLEMLVEQCAAYEGFRLLRGVGVRDLVRDGGRVAGVHFGGEQEGELRADYVVGADGRSSLVRRRAGLHEVSDPERFDVVWFKLPAEEAPDRAEAVQFQLARGHGILLFPSYDDRTQVAWLIDKGTFGELKRRGIEAWVDEMVEHATPGLAGRLRAHRDRVENPFVLDVVCHRLRRWSAPGVALLGDACHPMSPVGGQGINIALRDAIVLANELVPALEAGADPAALDAAARRFQEEREPEVGTIQRMQRIPPHFFFQRTWWARLAIRAFPFLLRRDMLRGRGGVAVRRIAFGVTEVRLRV